MADKLTQERVIEQFIEKHGDKYIYDRVEYIGNDTKVLIGCRIDDHGYFPQTPSNHKRGKGCPTCSGRVELTLDDIKLKLKNINQNIEIISEEYISSNSKIKCKCKIDNHEWSPTWNSLQSQHGCPVCSGRALHDGNRLSLIRPDLIKYFLNNEESNCVSVNSGKKVYVKCPECGMKKNKMMKVDTLSKYGFSCDYCSDKGVSIPEKFGIYLLKQLNINFETQKVFNWSKNRIYDKYLEFGVDGNNRILEIHGKQHYVETGRGRSLKEEQENDLLKYNLAIENGIKPENYIIIDCRFSEFEWLKENYIKQLENYLDLSNIDWLKVWSDCQSSLLVKVWEAWDNRKEDDTTKTISVKFGLSRGTTIRYLTRGYDIGKCTYNAKEESIKSGSINGGKNSISVCQYTLNDEILNTFESITSASIHTGASPTVIDRCCNGKGKTAGGFKWSYI